MAETCPACTGTGMAPDDEMECRTCGGTGMLVDSEKWRGFLENPPTWFADAASSALEQWKARALNAEGAHANTLRRHEAALATARDEALEACANKAREWADHYPVGSDGRNTFVLFAEW